MTTMITMTTTMKTTAATIAIVDKGSPSTCFAEKRYKIRRNERLIIIVIISRIKFLVQGLTEKLRPDELLVV